LPDQFLFVVQLRIKVDVVHSGKSGHASLLALRTHPV
jgi:hypothetical protein